MRQIRAKSPDESKREERERERERETGLVGINDTGWAWNVWH